jgi:hypothetical protein
MKDPPAVLARPLRTLVIYIAPVDFKIYKFFIFKKLIAVQKVLLTAAVTYFVES